MVQVASCSKGREYEEDRILYQWIIILDYEIDE